MRCLIVLAHPVTHSVSHAIAETTVDALEKNGHEYRLIDLYQSGFDPRLTISEREGYYQNFDKSMLAKEIDDLQWAEAIVLIFPTWWFGPPAILKGWFDRVWAPSIAYDHAGDLGTIKPRLRGLRKVVAFTTLGSPWWVDYFVLRRPVRHVLKNAVLRGCAPNASLKFISLYKAERIGERAAADLMVRIRKTISSL
jgi:NAD(P)H dehydrogenase (quinone)